MPGPEESPTSPPPAARRRRKWLVGGVALLVVLLAIVAYASSINEPAYYDSIDEHFKYGTIGSDEPYRGLPRAVLEVLPEVFPEYLPPGAPRDYTAFGFIQEPGHTLPIGFSKRRRLGIDLMGLNCSVCHVTTVREAPGSPARLYLGTPANTVDLEAFFEFLFNCGGDERFT
ncbi:MAG TPA: hypothetical protein VLQ93_08650 [Myxococcaceae bacterium]|nr:hypothetical protein [Myxococcaceae bacterium]